MNQRGAAQRSRKEDLELLGVIIDKNAHRERGGTAIHIEYYNEFITLAGELNYHNAAEQLHVSQSALSKHIAELERYHGVRLLERDRTSVRLTAKGAVFLEQASELMSAHAALMNLFSQSDDAPALSISGVLDSPIDFPLVSRVLELCQEEGMAKMPTFLPCESVSLADQTDILRRGDADCALIFTTPDALRELPDEAALQSRKVFHIPMDAIVQRDHPLADRNSLTLDDLDAQTIIRIIGPRFSTAWASLESQLSRAAIHVKTKLAPASSAYEYVTWNPEEAVLLVQRAPVFSTAMQSASCLRIPIEDERLRLPLTAIYPASAPSPELSTFLDKLEQAYREAFEPS